MRNRRSSIAANPILIGAATVLVTVVAVFLAYNANSGLPFVPVYTVHVRLPSAASLVRGNDVRVAGIRVGTISRIAPVQDDRTGAVGADLTLKLERRLGPLPVDSTFIVRSRSALGLKYLQVTVGRSRRGFPDGATVPVANARPEPVEIDDVLNTFDAPTRKAASTNLDTFGTAFAGRGQDLGETIDAFRPLLASLEPLMRNLASPATNLRGLFPGLEATASAVAPVAEDQAGFFRGLDTTFGAIASVTRPFVQDAISEGPPSIAQATRSLRAERPFLGTAERFFAELRPAAAAIRGASAPIGRAVARGGPVLRRARALNDRLAPLLDALGKLGGDQAALQGALDAAATGTATKALAGSLRGAQATCNYGTLLLRNLASTLADGDATGTWLRFLTVIAPVAPNNEGGPASAPANGGPAENHLHTNPYPNVAAPGQPHECEAGNEGYAAGRTAIGNVPGNQGTTHDVTKREVKR